MIVKDTQNRRKLGEGRNSGFGQAFAEIKKDDTLETIMPITACKDFLNDQLYTLRTSKPVRIYGFDPVYNKDILNGDYFYMVGKVLPINYNDSPYKHYDRDIELSIRNRDAILSFINQFEQELRFNSLTEFINCENDESLIIFRVPIEWSYSLQSISLYGMICRLGIWYDYSDLNTYLSNFNYDSYDTFNAKKLMDDFKIMKQKGNMYTISDFSKFNSSSRIHDYGYKEHIREII